MLLSSEPMGKAFMPRNENQFAAPPHTLPEGTKEGSAERSATRGKRSLEFR